VFVTTSTEVQGMHQALSAINRAKRVEARPALIVMSQIVKTQTLRRINSTKTDPDGKKWDELKPETIRRKGGDDILVRSGTMRDSVAIAISGNQAEVGTSTPYAKYHHAGTSKMPKRQFLGIGSGDRKELEAALNAYIARAIGR
jgi:phage virion morphogenesis protein